MLANHITGGVNGAIDSPWFYLGCLVFLVLFIIAGFVLHRRRNSKRRGSLYVEDDRGRMVRKVK